MNEADGSTDTVVLHRGHHDFGDTPPPPNPDPNRTTVHLPLVTTAVGTNQRPAIVNRLFRRVRYAIALHPEGDATASPATVRGTAAPRSATTLRLGDRVTLNGTTRASATMTLMATPAYVDVVTTLVNQSDGATDTVVLHRGAHGG